MWDGTELTDQLALPPAGDARDLCVESPMMGWYAQPSDTTPDNFGQTVNGNYGFGTSDYNLLTPDDPDDPTDPATGNPLPYLANLADYGLDPQPLVNTDYMVKVDIPKDQYGKPLYKVTQEEDVNIFDGDSYLPQDNFPPHARRGDEHAIRRAADRDRRVRRAAVPGQRVPLTVRRRATTSCTSRTRLRRRRRQPVRGPAAADLRRQAGHRPRQPGRRAELQPVHPGPAAHPLLGPDHQRPGSVPRQAPASATARRSLCPTSRWASTTGPAGSSTP